MARGKYSPTVTAAYMKNHKWHTNFMPLGGFIYDAECYDSYGYNEDDIDRAGNNEYDYIVNDGDFSSDEDYNNLYDQTLGEWGFDGVKPVPR